ncbi:hypothetical protein ABK850_08660, partial [Enterobacter hormaechei]|uniref:hypothetical protein n=1 Tax=Enterobacter hormaechei TaxID=158836 RepID=UPI003751AFF2
KVIFRNFVGRSRLVSWLSLLLNRALGVRHGHKTSRHDASLSSYLLVLKTNDAKGNMLRYAV